MADKFYAKGPGNNGYIKNLEVLDFNPWNGKSGVFQMQVYKTAEGKYYLYGSCFGGSQDACSDRRHYRSGTYKICKTSAAVRSGRISDYLYP